MTSAHRRALSPLEYGLEAGARLTVLTGEASTGKTTLIRTALRSSEAHDVRIVYLNNPTLTRNEFLEFLSQEFALGTEAARSKAVLIRRLPETLLNLRREGGKAELIIDEAQGFPDELLEEVRLLANIETESRKPTLVGHAVQCRYVQTDRGRIWDLRCP